MQPAHPIGEVQMDFLKKFLRSNWRNGDAVQGKSSFQGVSEDDLNAHMEIARYLTTTNGAAASTSGR